MTNSVTTLSVGRNALRVAVDQNSQTAYVTNYEDSTISVIDTRTNTVTGTIALGTNPDDRRRAPMLSGCRSHQGGYVHAMVALTRQMRCTPDDVLRVLADGWTYANWVVGSSRIRGVDRTWPAPGSRIAHSVGVWPLVINDVTISHWWDPGSGIEMRARAWPAGEAQVRIEVKPQGAGCRVRMTEDAVRGPVTLIPRRVRSAMLVPRNKETLRRLAMIAEGRPAAGAPT